MLVLSRKPRQEIVIGNDIVVTVLEVHGNRVKLGVAGPTQVPIRRRELAPHIAPVRAEFVPASRASRSPCRAG